MRQPDAKSDASASELNRLWRRHRAVAAERDDSCLVVKAEGARIETAAGEKLLDFASGGFLPLGHRSHPAAGGPELGPGQESPTAIRLMAKLAEIAPGAPNRRVLLCDSGREAMAQALKLAQQVTDRTAVSYLSDLRGSEVAVGTDVAALVVHPLDCRVEIAAGCCREAGALLVDDETTVAPGTSGAMLAIETAGVRPDLYVLGRGLAAGEPLGACVTARSTLAWTEPATGASPHSCSAALDYLGKLESGLLERGRAAAALLTGQLSGTEGLGAAGAGLALALRMANEGAASRLHRKCREAGLLLGRQSAAVVMMSPPIDVDESEINEAAAIINSVLASQR